MENVSKLPKIKYFFFDFLIPPSPALPGGLTDQRKIPQMPLKRLKIVRIQKVIPLFTLTFYKESNGMGYFIHKCVFKKTSIFPGFKIQVKMQNFHFFPIWIVTSSLLLPGKLKFACGFFVLF